MRNSVEKFLTTNYKEYLRRHFLEKEELRREKAKRPIEEKWPESLDFGKALKKFRKITKSKKHAK